jgi:hypothetical protein
MIRLCAVNGIRHDAVKRGIERRQISQESAPLAVGAIALVPIRFEKTFRFPIRRRVRNRIHLVENVLPVAAYVARSREDTRHPNDGDVTTGAWSGSTHEVLPTAETLSG